MSWTKSSFCYESGCVEVDVAADEIRVRDSTNPDVVVTHSPESWVEFLKGVRNGEFEASTEN